MLPEKNDQPVHHLDSRGPAPATHTCFRCGRTGHWAKYCPGRNVHRPPGIPKDELMEITPIDQPTTLTPSGRYVVPIMDKQAHLTGKKERPPFSKAETLVLEPTPEKEIPSELKCAVCYGTLRDAVVVRCCGYSFCDECIRLCLIESDCRQCPHCGEQNISPDTLVPNRQLREAVSNYRNETGYAYAKRQRMDADHGEQSSWMLPTTSTSRKSKINLGSSTTSSTCQHLPAAPSSDTAVPSGLVNDSFFQIGFGNAQGCVSKAADVKKIVTSGNYDLFGVLETKASFKIANDHFALDGYQMKRIYAGGKAGGIITYIRNGITVEHYDEVPCYTVRSGYVQFMALELEKNGTHVVVIVAYVSQRSKEAITYLRHYCTAEYGDKLERLVVVGDFNADLRKCGDMWTLIEGIRGVQTVEEPSHGKSFLDLVILGNEAAHLKTMLVPAIGGSDHSAVHTTLDMTAYVDDRSPASITDTRMEDALPTKETGPACSSAQPKRERFYCEVAGCGTSYSTKATLKKHVTEFHATAPLYRCEFCEREFTHQQSYINHQRIHQNEMPYICSKCHQRFRSYANLTAHDHQVHSVQRDFKCTKCEYECSTLGDLKKHMHSHTGERPYKCQYCTRSFSDRCTARRHERQVHLGVKSFRCGQCTKSFATAADLTRHQRAHSGEKPFKCQFCPRAFATSHNRTTHENIHRGEKPFKCRYCPKAFGQRNNRNRHERQVHGKQASVPTDSNELVTGPGDVDLF